MAETHIHGEVAQQGRTASAAEDGTSTGHTGPTRGLTRHFLEMLAAMMVGMCAASAVFVSIVGLKSWSEVTLEYPTQALLTMAAGMTIPMVAWMLFRGMGWRDSSEMALAMLLPVIPFLCLVWFGVTKSAWCGAYCAVTVVAMLGLMIYRRERYAHH